MGTPDTNWPEFEPDLSYFIINATWNVETNPKKTQYLFFSSKLISQGAISGMTITDFLVFMITHIGSLPLLWLCRCARLYS